MTEKAGSDDAPVEQPDGGESEQSGSDRLRASRRAFEAGDYRLVRKLGSEIERSGDPEEAGAARELLDRVAVDPALLAALLVFAALFFGIVYAYVFR